MSYHNILIAVDLSVHSEQVISAAKNLIKDRPITTHIAHVIEHSPIAYGGEFSIQIDVNLEYKIETQARELLSELAKKATIPASKQHILSGSVKRSITTLAKKLETDLIIVGTHGHHGLDKILGSHANAILHAAECDVLVVRIKP